MTHTPGPWEAPGKDGDSFPICTHRNLGKRRTIAHAYTADDARSMAAVPNLLQALQLAEATIRRLDRNQSAQGTLDVIRIALAEAGA